MNFSLESNIQTAVLDRNIYVRTVGAIIWVYDTQEEQWSEVYRNDSICDYAMVLNNDQLVVAGGVVKDGIKSTAKDVVAVWNVSSKRWDYPYPPMPTWRSGALSIRYQQYLIFVGGIQYSYSDDSDFYERIAAMNVEVLDTSRSQWFVAEPLPEPCYLNQCVAIRDTLYLLGSRSSSGHQVILECSVPTLISLATSKSTATFPTWKILPDTPLKFYSFVSYKDSLLAIGGHSSQIIPGIYAYQSDTSKWSNIGDLPTALTITMCVVLPSNEFFVLSGRKVYIGTPDFESSH